MKDKTKLNGTTIILPDQDGVADLDIRRVQKEMTVDDEPIEMHGHMPAKMVEPVISEMKNIIAAIERGEVSSVCVIALMPKSEFEDAGNCFIGGMSDQLDKIHEMFHLSLLERMDLEPPDEAG